MKISWKIMKKDLKNCRADSLPAFRAAAYNHVKTNLLQLQQFIF